MLKKLLSFLTVVVIFTTTVFCEETSAPKNIIFMIGDGMGVNYVSASVYTIEDNAFKRFDQLGLVVTCSADALVTDSAAGATAYSCGIRTYNGAIGVDVDKQSVETIIEFLEEKGKATGVISTSAVTHATPASFVAHVELRKMEFDIAEDFSNSSIDMVIGGGWGYFTPKDEDGEGGGDRLDGKNLVDVIKDNGYEYFDNVDDFLSADIEGNVYALLEKHELPGAGSRDYSLADLTVKAVENLSSNEEGFFLMVEGSQIDWAGHANSQEYALEELADFNEAVNAALDFAEADGNTLVVVTADHETGGMGLIGGNVEQREVKMGWVHKHHTANMVGVYSYGPGSEHFGKIMDNYKIGQQLFKFYDEEREWK